MNYQKKYLKYKSRYLALKGGSSSSKVYDLLSNPGTQSLINSFMDLRSLTNFIGSDKIT